MKPKKDPKTDPPPRTPASLSTRGEGPDEPPSGRVQGEAPANPTKFAMRRAKELRQSMTPCERVLWDHLRDRRLAGLKFRRQHPIGPFIVDFYCAAARLVIEIDGAIHAYQQEKDALREKWLLERRFRVLRFTNRSVDREIGPVLHAIEAACLQASSRSIHEEGMDKAPGQVL